MMRILYLMTVVGLCWSALAEAVPAKPTQPRLVLVIVVDQLRGDMPWRFQERLEPAGLRLLMEQGVAYQQAHYRHSTTLTATGHATLATGGHAAQHGLAANDWYDQRTREHVYCVEDARHHVLGCAPAKHSGTSPANLTCTTFGDELVLASDGTSRVFSVSMKDRGAILLAGHLGKAFWYRSDTGQFITSSFYYDAYPNWVNDWNQSGRAGKYEDGEWELLRDPASYLYARRDDRPCEQSFGSLGRTFPHPLGSRSTSDFYSGLRFTPMGDELTLDFARQIFTSERLGQGPDTDILAISLSVTDYIGHVFGPNSLEAEDNLLRLDHSLAQFFAFVAESVPLDETLIVVSADHGVDASPEYMLSLGLSAGRYVPQRWIDSLNEALRQRLRIERDLVLAIWNPSVYLDIAAIDALNLDRERVEHALAEELLQMEGIAMAITRSDLIAGRVATDPISQKVQRAFHPRRSGNVLVVPSPNWQSYSVDSLFSTMHGSPYPYDTHVPILFGGAGIDPRIVQREVAPQDVAPTIASLLGIQSPSGSTGTALVEVLAGDE